MMNKNFLNNCLMELCFF